jgi:hypothetical protein
VIDEVRVSYSVGTKKPEERAAELIISNREVRAGLL